MEFAGFIVLRCMRNDVLGNEVLRSLLYSKLVWIQGSHDLLPFVAFTGRSGRPWPSSHRSWPARSAYLHPDNLLPGRPEHMRRAGHAWIETVNRPQHFQGLIRNSQAMSIQ